VRVLGREVELADGARIDASGQRGGGTVLVGGDYQGRNPEVQNAAATTVAAGATVRADALDAGDGGRIVVWSDGTTRVDGALSADGGPKAGDGGFVETSGTQLRVGPGARVSAAAPAGRVGQWLLDPHDIVIANVEQDYPAGGDVDAVVLSNALATTNVTIATGVPPDNETRAISRSPRTSSRAPERAGRS